MFSSPDMRCELISFVFLRVVFLLLYSVSSVLQNAFDRHYHCFGFVFFAGGSVDHAHSFPLSQGNDFAAVDCLFALFLILLFNLHLRICRSSFRAPFAPLAP